MNASNTAAAPRPWLGLVAGLTAITATFALITLGADRPEAPASPPRAAAPAAVSTIEGKAMDGTWSIKFARPPATRTPEQLQRDVAALLERLEDQISVYRATSAVSRFNAHRGTDWVEVPADLARVVDEARVVSEHSDGAFDVTVGALVNLWGFGPAADPHKAARVPSDAEVAAARAHVDYRRLHARRSPPALKKDDPAIVLDLSGIARGYAVAEIAAALDAAGATDYLIRVGAEARAKGLSPHHRAWRLALDAPPADDRATAAAAGPHVELRDCAASTSADYRAFFEVNGRRYCHEIDPHTGRPINHRLASVSVIHENSAYADAMATALMVLGTTDGQAAADRLGLSVLWVERAKDHFETRTTTPFARFVTQVKNPHASDAAAD